ncbi:MAG: pilus assembly protein N-terminal domain-containing protein [Candidatus Melainabacteria bacterium]|nr:pilus assembly protein N-terminal domain-containing protein [Candidatus Melainabacteria bacterium]
MKPFIKTLFLLTLISAFCIQTIIPVSSKVFFLEADYYQDKTQIKKLNLGKGEIISSDKTILRVAVSDPAIVDLQVLNEKEVFVRAKKLGISTIIMWEKETSHPARFDISVWPDIDYLTKQLQDLDKNITVEYIPPSSNISSTSKTSSEQTSVATSSLSQAAASSSTPSPTAGSSSSTTSSSTAATSGKIILKGEVSNAEIIARALQIAGVYVGDQGIKIISQPGGQIVDGLAGRYDISANSDSQGQTQTQGSAVSFGARDPIKFTSNRYANLSRGVIATTQNGSVISFLTVKDPPQVSVAIRFFEVSRSVARNLGFNTTFGGSTIQGGTFIGGSGIGQLLGQIGSIANLTEFKAASGGSAPEFGFGHGSVAGGSVVAQTIGDGVTGAIFNPDNGIGVVLQALQERGEIKTLAEPNLVVANGEPASFLAGGEVPIVRSVFTAGGASQDITYEPFGIRFVILPTVTGENKIYLQLSPEIRDIDTNLSNLVVPVGSTSVRPPAFRTRRTQTQVELETGQAFAISGLLREDNTRNLRKVPGIGDIPILGTLFRSKSFRQGETELLVVVSPQIVRPTSVAKISKLAKPEIPYHDFDELAPFKPYIKKDDEKGPDMKEPLDAGKYNESTNKKVDNNISLNNEYSELRKLNNFKKNEDKLKRQQQLLNAAWRIETARYAQAQEAMRLARENKISSY